MKNKMVVGDIWKENNSSFSRMNILFFSCCTIGKFGMDGRDS